MIRKKKLRTRRINKRITYYRRQKKLKDLIAIVNLKENQDEYDMDTPIPSIECVTNEKRGFAHYISSHRKPKFAKFVQRRPKWQLKLLKQ